MTQDELKKIKDFHKFLKSLKARPVENTVCGLRKSGSKVRNDLCYTIASISNILNDMQHIIFTIESQSVEMGKNR